uniref:C-type lectin domain-containing protein n=1 Tax=Gasterosteus aculeatus aculeatus TaxID=481459 RepID=A0AAQ4PTI8_GASAC|nr:macrophage mannose receptor 1-like [Gasterosteus aculeatus aculeatus]
MDCCLPLIVLFCGVNFISCSHLPPLRKYYYVDKLMTWAGAQRYCREKYTDLATFESMDDVSRLPPDTTYRWIGLSDDPKSWRGTMGNDPNSWRWSSTGETSRTGYQNWAAGKPTNPLQTCAVMLTDGRWNEYSCESAFYFICYTETNQATKSYVLIQLSKRWSAARDYCRQRYTDLAKIENDEEQNKVNSVKLQYYIVVWIGLYRVPWTWSDKSQSSIRMWASGEPNNGDMIEICAAQYPSHQWNDDNCFKLLPFICHQVITLKTTLRIKFETDADITDPALNTQILQQLSAALTRQGFTDFKLRWKIPPKKQEKLQESPCTING